MRLITITGPSGVGKGYLKDALKRRWYGQIYEPPWYTTRPARADEYSRHDRVCVSQEEFSLQRFFICDKVGDHQYGLLELDATRYSIVLTELRFHLLNQLASSEVFSIGLVAELDFLYAQLIGRATEDSSAIGQRLQIACDEIPQILEQRKKFSFFYQVGSENKHLLVSTCIQVISAFMAKE